MEAKHSSDQIGRAGVQDKPELEVYYKKLETPGGDTFSLIDNLVAFNEKDNIL